MNLFVKLLALLKACLPLPTEITDPAELLKYWNAIGPAVTDLIASIAQQIIQTSKAVVQLPSGMVIDLIRQQDGTWCALPPSREDNTHLVSAVRAADPQTFGKLGDGKILELIMKFLPLILEILPLFLDKDGKPLPKPAGPDALTVD